MNDEQRSKWGRAIAESRRRNHTPEELSEIASRNAKALYEEDPEARARVGSTVRSWWANLTPEARAEFLARRTEKIRAAKAAKRPKPPG
jgi:hypothetical protein